MSGSERQYPRYAHEATVRLRFGDEQVVTGSSRNVSRGGLCATIVEQIATGTEVELDITLLFDDESRSEPLTVKARVVWCTPFESAHQVGVAFRPLTKQDTEYLTLFLKYLDEGKAPKQPRAKTVDEKFR